MKTLKKEPDLPFKSESFEKAWKEWITYRKERRLPNYVPMGLQKTFTRLVNDSGNSEEEAIKMIEYSMSQNYQGIFKEKINGTRIGNNQNSVKQSGNRKDAGANQLAEKLSKEIGSYTGTGDN